jgi:hypothetical protein
MTADPQNQFITFGYHIEKYFCDRSEETKKLTKTRCLTTAVWPQYKAR